MSNSINNLSNAELYIKINTEIEAAKQVLAAISFFANEM